MSELSREKAADLSNIWRTKQFEYTSLRTLSRRYSDFWQVTAELGVAPDAGGETLNDLLAFLASQSPPA